MATKRRSASTVSAKMRQEVIEDRNVASAAAEKRVCNGHGRFKPTEAGAIARITSDEQFSFAYPQLFHETAKQMMWELHLLFDGQIVDTDGRTHYLDRRLAPELQAEALEAFRTLWSVISRKSFVRTAAAAARSDSSFRQFLSRTAGQLADGAAPSL